MMGRRGGLRTQEACTAPLRPTAHASSGNKETEVQLGTQESVYQALGPGCDPAQNSFPRSKRFAQTGKTLCANSSQLILGTNVNLSHPGLALLPTAPILVHPCQTPTHPSEPPSVTVPEKPSIRSRKRDPQKWDRTASGQVQLRQEKKKKKARR